MLRQANCSGTVPGHHWMWSAQELDEEWLACSAGAAGRGMAAAAPPGPFGTGAGFAAGGQLEPLSAGSGACRVRPRTPGPDELGTLSDDALVGVLQAWRRLASWAAAGELAAVAELDRRRKAEVARPPGPTRTWPSMWATNLAASLTLTTRSADALLDILISRAALARLPMTRAALANRTDRPSEGTGHHRRGQLPE